MRAPTTRCSFTSGPCSEQTAQGVTDRPVGNPGRHLIGSIIFAVLSFSPSGIDRFGGCQTARVVQLLARVRMADDQAKRERHRVAANLRGVRRAITSTATLILAAVIAAGTSELGKSPDGVLFQATTVLRRRPAIPSDQADQPLRRHQPPTTPIGDMPATLGAGDGRSVFPSAAASTAVSTPLFFTRGFPPGFYPHQLCPSGPSRVTGLRRGEVPLLFSAERLRGADWISDARACPSPLQRAGNAA